MKYYYTLVQELFPKDERPLSDYLDSNSIRYKISADFVKNLVDFGYKAPSSNNTTFPEDVFLSKYTVLIEEHELSAIQLAVGGVSIIRNRSSVERLNKLRRMLAWFLRR